MSRPVAQDRIARYVERIEREEATLEELCERLTCARYAEGDKFEPPETLAEVCRAWDIPVGKFGAWLAASPERTERYEAALRIRAQMLADEALVIADTPRDGARVTEKPGETVTVTEDMLGHRKLQVDTRRWLAGKFDRARFGDALVVQHTGETVVRLTFGRAGGAVPELTVVGSSSIAGAEADGEI